MRLSASLDNVQKLFGKITSQNEQLESKSEKIQKTWGKIAASIRESEQLHRLLSRLPASNVTSALLGTHPSVGAGFTNTTALFEQLKRVKVEVEDLTKMRDEARAKGLIFPKDEQARLAAASTLLGDLQKNFNGLQSQNKFLDHLANVHSRWQLFRGGTSLFLLTTTARAVGEIRRALVESQDAYDTRMEQVKDIFTVHLATGAALSNITRGAQALVAVGRNVGRNWQDDLKVVTQLEEGLGMSADNAARLSYVADKLNVPFRSLANTLASIVGYSGLSADEAGRYADNLGRAILLLRNTGGANETIRSALQIEGAIKRAGGVSGEWSEMISRMMRTTEGAMMAQAFGARPESLNTPRGQEQLLAQLSRLVNSQTRGADQQTKLSVLEGYSHMLGLSVDTLNRLTEAMQENRRVAIGRLTIEDRWRNQMMDLTSVFHRLYESTRAVIFQVATPLVGILTRLLRPLADTIGWLAKFPKVLNGMAIAATVFGGYAATVAIARTWGLVRALVALAAAEKLAAKAAKDRTGSIILDSLGRSIPGGSAGGWWSRITALFSRSRLLPALKAIISNPLVRLTTIAGLIATVLGSIFIWLQRRKYLQATRIGEQVQIALGKKASDISDYHKALAGASKPEDVVHAMKTLKLLASREKDEKGNPLFSESAVGNLFREAQDELVAMGDNLVGRMMIKRTATKEDVESLNTLQRIEKKIEEMVENQYKAAIRESQEAKDAATRFKNAQRQNEIDRATSNSRMANPSTDPLRDLPLKYQP